MTEIYEGPKGLIVLGMFLHCQGCIDEVVKCLKGFEGVEQIETDANEHKITVKGEKADPKKVWDRVKKKTGKYVTLISPILKEIIEIVEEKEEPIKVVEVVIKVYLHCEGCARDVKYIIHNMKGVYTVETNVNDSEVTVKGVFEAGKLVEYMKKKTKKHVNIVKETLLTDKYNKLMEEKKEENIVIINEYHHFYPTQTVYSDFPLFSHENPNSCSLM